MSQEIRLETGNGKKELILKLKEMIPMVFQEGKLNTELLRDLLGEENTRKTFYGLSWPKKLDTYHIAQEGTNKTFKPYPKDSYQWETASHILINGENLDSLRLLKESYKGKVKMIYIDPPYNTGSDSFIYPDKFKQKKEVYDQDSGKKDDEGNQNSSFRENRKENGHFHSNWLNMMLSRLILARDLLREDGVIFVSIDDNEQANLKLLMDEVFGEENFVGDFIRKTKSTTNDSKTGVNYQHEFLLCYAKQKEKISLLGGEKDLTIYSNPDNDPNGEWASSDPSAKSGKMESNYFSVKNPYTGKDDYPPSGRFWAFSKNTINQHIQKGTICFKKEHKENERGFIYKRYLKNLKTNYKVFDSLFFTDNSYMNQSFTKELKELDLEKYFTYPKGSNFLKKIIEHSTSSDSSDIILDFFAGSGTIAQAVIEMNEEDGGNRRYICVQLPEVIEEKTEAYKAGYRTIFDITKARIDKVIEKIQKERENKELENPPSLGYRLFQLEDSIYENMYSDIKDKDALKDFLKRTLDLESKGILLEEVIWEILIKEEKIDLNTSFIKEQKAENLFVYNILSSKEDKETILFLEGDGSEQKLEEIILSYHPKPIRVYALDSFFKGSDSLKANLSFNLKEKDIELKTY